MNVVGKVGSLISQGVYSFFTPFLLFVGAIDIIVVGSTPWYVHYGKFQGTIKGAEKLVTISVNSVDADFHMNLDHSGQAYFMREVEGSDSLSSSLASVEGNPHKSSQDDTTCNNAQVRESVYEEHRVEDGNDENSYMFTEAHSSPARLHSSPARSSCSPGFSPYSYGDLEDVEEIMKSSNVSNSEMMLISVDEHVLTAPISSNEEESADFVELTNLQFHLGPGESSGKEFGAIFGDLDTSSQNDTNTSEHPSEGPKDAKEDSICMDEAHANSRNKKW